jgi:hypothetical protein
MKFFRSREYVHKPRRCLISLFIPHRFIHFIWIDFQNDLELTAEVLAAKGAKEQTLITLNLCE